MYSYSYLQPVCCSMSSSNCCFLTCLQVSQEAGQVVWYSHLFQNFLQFKTVVQSETYVKIAQSSSSSLKNNFEVIPFALSRQSPYRSGLGWKWARGFSKHSVICTRRKSMDCPPTVINTWISSGVIRMGACVGTPGHLQSCLSWESDLWNLCLCGQFLL